MTNSPLSAAKLCGFRLNRAPTIAGRVTESIEYDGRTALAGAKNIERAPADIDGPANLQIPPPVPALSNLFQKSARTQHCDNADRNQLESRLLVAGGPSHGLIRLHRHQSGS